MNHASVNFNSVVEARDVISRFLTPTPLLRSYCLEQFLKLPSHRRVWLKDYGWTPVGSFKVLGALNWMSHHEGELGARPVAAHSSGNFASGIAFAGHQFDKRVIIVMPDTAPKVKFELTRSFGAEIRTYNIATDHETGLRDKMTREIAEQELALQASPYDDPHVIAGNGVGGLEICEQLQSVNRQLSHFVCPISGGGLMAGHAIAVDHVFPDAYIIGVEPENANDFQLSMQSGVRTRVDHPTSICDGLLSYDVGQHNWPILKSTVDSSVTVPDLEIQFAMKWIYENHGLRTEPSGAIGVAAALLGRCDLSGEHDIVIVVSGRNIDEERFRSHISSGAQLSR